MFKMIGTDGAPWVNGWTAGGCYNQIINQMGYWLQLDSITHQSTAVHGQTVTFSVNLRNLGFSRFFTPRKIVATLISGGNTVTCASRLDLRALPPQATGSFTITIPACAIPNAGTYTVYLNVPDIGSQTAGVRKFTVQFGNSNSGAQIWDDTNGRMATGTTIVVS
jgi:hypothetical protein